MFKWVRNKGIPPFPPQKVIKTIHKNKRKKEKKLVYLFYISSSKFGL
jgi:hypothetical protein